jgi:hypothetical protein
MTENADSCLLSLFIAQYESNLIKKYSIIVKWVGWGSVRVKNQGRHP